MIKVIVFDYAEVVAEGPILRWVKENIKPNDKKLLEYREKMHEWDLGEIAVDEAYEIIGRLTQTPPNLIWETFYEKSKSNKEIIALIKKLKINYKIILFSNFMGELLRKLLKKHGIEELFDEIIISSEHKMKKPDPKFFETLVKKAGVKKEEILFTDDKINNVEASNKFGIKAFQFITTKQLIEDLKSEGVKVD
ncbi:MAG: HAD-IA family hydrolase [Patescibacteria group bacterium]|nr:HAD-IA family hydrolase [Patescibacteria group bacterium]